MIAMYSASFDRAAITIVGGVRDLGALEIVYMTNAQGQRQPKLESRPVPVLVSHQVLIVLTLIEAILRDSTFTRGRRVETKKCGRDLIDRCCH